MGPLTRRTISAGGSDATARNQTSQHCAACGACVPSHYTLHTSSIIASTPGVTRGRWVMAASCSQTMLEQPFVVFVRRCDQAGDGRGQLLTAVSSRQSTAGTNCFDAPQASLCCMTPVGLSAALLQSTRCRCVNGVPAGFLQRTQLWKCRNHNYHVLPHTRLCVLSGIDAVDCKEAGVSSMRMHTFGRQKVVGVVICWRFPAHDSVYPAACA